MNKIELNIKQPIQSIIIYDGDCNFCISIIKFVRKRDNKKVLLFIHIQEKEGRLILRKHNENFINLQTVYFIHSGQMYKKSTAIFKIFSLLPFPWKIISLFKIFPISFTDFMYNFIAKYRYRLFGKVNK